MDTNARLLVDTAQIPSGSVCFQAPSNIALIKYWGKHGQQLPRNANVSFTLSVARSITRLQWDPKSAAGAQDIKVRLFYDGEEKANFASRIVKYFQSLLPWYPFLGQFDWTIHTTNTFPHGAGIASSASAMAALAMCLSEVKSQWFMDASRSSGSESRLQEASFIARLGSGSAARSVFAKAAAWGSSPFVEGSSDLHALPIGPQMHQVFQDYQDSILLVSEEEKSVSSTAGHGLMDQQPYAPIRYEMANRRFGRMLDILRHGDLDDFCTLVEADALDLHALMMQSYPPYILMEPATIQIIQAVQRFRQNTKQPVCFTLDAGPNVHLLYPKSISTQVDEWLSSEIFPLLPAGCIHDHVGDGPSKASLPDKAQPQELHT